MIRVGVIGYGYWGPNLVRNLYANKNFQVMRVCDLNPANLDLVKERYPTIEVTSNIRDMVKDDIDALAIATPVGSHAALVELALNHGKHVLVEKPFTASSLDAVRLNDLAKQKNKILMVDHVYVYSPAVRKIKEIYDGGQLGEGIYFDGTRINLGLFQKDVNVLWDLAVHDVSIMLYLFNERPTSVSATGLGYSPNGLESIVYVTLFFEKKMIAHFHVSWLSPVKVRNILIGGDKKMIHYDDIEASEKIKIYDKGLEPFPSPSSEKSYDLRVGYRYGDMVSPKIDNAEALKFVCEDFAQSIKNNRAPISDGQMGIDVVRILEAASQSLKQRGKEIAL